MDVLYRYDEKSRCKQIRLLSIFEKKVWEWISPLLALCVMCVTSRLMELWAAPFAGCGKAALAFSYAVNGVVHSGMGSYAHFHDVFLLL